MAGTIERIHIGDVKGEPVRSLDSVDAVAGKGLAGDRNFERMGTWNDGKPGRDLTLIEAEAVEALARDHGIELAPGESRRNLTTRGVRLNQLVGKDFWIGGVLARGVRPC